MVNPRSECARSFQVNVGHSGKRESHTGPVTFYGDFLARVGQRWDMRWTHRAFAPPTDAQRLSPSHIRRLVRVGLVTDVTVISLLLVSLVLDWDVMTKLLLAGVVFRALSWCLVWAIVKKNRQL
jgi:hypothetical protein